jgi:hypothetical protein
LIFNHRLRVFRRSDRVFSSSVNAAIAAATLFGWPAGLCSAQHRGAPPRTLLVSGTAATEIPSNFIREIDDPSNGDRWLLERDPSNPGGPGRLVRIPRGAARAAVSSGDGSSASPSAYQPVIHAGDRLIVEENTPVVEARLEAVALTPAEPGGTLRVRLEMGGKVFEAVAIGPGRAELAPETGAQP